MRLSIVIPVLNEDEVIDLTIQQVIKCIPFEYSNDYEIIIVDDGSADDTAIVVNQICEEYPSVRMLSFTRNFGKEAAILAGLRLSVGDAVIVIDGDLQHPPSSIPAMLKAWENGAKVVNGCKRDKGTQSYIYRLSSSMFYSLFEKMTGIDMKGHSDFKLLDKEVVSTYCNLPEKVRFFRAAIPYLGYQSTAVYFDVGERSGGTSSWSYRSLIRYSINGIANFTSIPLHLISFASIAVFFVSVIMSISAFVQYINGSAVEGFTTVIILILFIGSMIMFSLGQIGIYLEKIFDEVKGRPEYIIDNIKSKNLCDDGKQVNVDIL